MSEYQYYEFQAIDRLLTDTEFTKIKNLSSRAIVTRNKAVFKYNYGDFRYEPLDILADCFDMMLYVANWGTRRLCFRLPKNLVNIEEIELYCIPDAITLSIINDHVILDICFQKDDFRHWIEGDGILPTFLSLRNDLLNNDYSALYIAWLGSFNLDNTEIDDNLTEPPVPSGLKKVSSTLKELIKFLDVDKYLIKIAASLSTEINLDNATKHCISKLPISERDALLLHVLNGEPNVDKLIRKRLKEISDTNIKKNHLVLGERTISQLTEKAKQLYKKNKAEKRRLKAEEKIAYLNALAPQESKIWSEVFMHINIKTSKGYECAVKQLAELKELADHHGTTEQFIIKVEKIMQDFSRYSALKEKIIAQKII